MISKYLNLAEIRAFFKEFRAIPKGEEYQKQANTVNALLPALIDAISDDELFKLMEEFRYYLLYSIIAGTLEEPFKDEKETAE